MPTIRQAKVGEMIRRELAVLLQKDLRDPRLSLVSVTDVDISRDFSIAKVFISVIGTAEEKTAAIKALQGAAGYLRGHLGRAMDLRTIPALAFRIDTGIDRGVRMHELLQEEAKAVAANAADASLLEDAEIEVDESLFEDAEGDEEEDEDTATTSPAEREKA